MTRLAKSQLRAIAPQIAAGVVPVVPAPPKRRRNEESEMQRALIRWWQANCRHFGVPEILLFSIPNGFNGDARRGSVMKLEGQRKGCPDLMLAVGSHNYEPFKDSSGSISLRFRPHGLFLELKTAKGQVSPEQEVFHERLRAQGYRVTVCRSLFECINEITAYLK